MSGDYKLMITKSAQKDKEKIKQYPALKRNVQNLLELISENPFKIHRLMNGLSEI